MSHLAQNSIGRLAGNTRLDNEIYMARRPPKVAQTTLSLNVQDGGLKAPDVFKTYEALRLQWAQRL